MIKRAGLFERVSTEEQARFGFSIRTQVDALDEYCRVNGYKIVDHYCDEGVSAGRPYQKRPEMKRMLDDVAAGKIDIILFTRLDRWFRNVTEYFKVQELLDRAGVQWRAIWEDYDTTTANGRMAITIFLAIAQNEREKTAERIKVVFANKIKNGEACFGGPVEPIGYRKQKDDAGVVRLVKDPETEPLVRDFWDSLLRGESLNGVIRKMGAVYGVTRNWKTWKRITQNELYCGRYKGNARFCDPYISQEDFLRYNARGSVRKNYRGRVYLFAGLMNCPVCGSRLCGDTSIKPSGVYKQYRCRLRGRGCTNHATYSEIKLEAQLLGRLDVLLADAIRTTEVEAAKPKAKPKADLAKLRERLRRLDVVYMAGNLSDEEYLRDQADIKARIREAEAAVPADPPDVSPLRELLQTDFRGLYALLDEAERQQFWRRLLRSITIEGKTVTSVDFL